MGISYIKNTLKAGADPGFLKRGFICINVRRFALLIKVYLIVLKYPIKMNLVSLTETKLFQFHTILNGGGGGGGSSEPPRPHLDPPLKGDGDIEIK